MAVRHSRLRKNLLVWHMPEGTLPRWISLESRRSRELAALLSRAGLAAIEAPSMQEVPLADQTEALAFCETLVAGDYELLVLLTGVGFRKLLEVGETRYGRDQLRQALLKHPIACRGPKPVAVLKELGIKPSLVAPEPNTYRELLDALDAWQPVKDMRIVVQEYGVPNAVLAEALRQRGAHVSSVSIYAWALPDDLGPLRAAVARLCAGEVEGVAFTSQQQLHHLLQIAAEDGKRDEVHRAMVEDCLVASIGPITTEALQAHGIPVDLEPQHPKMGHLVKLIKEEGGLALQNKRRAIDREAP